MGNRKVNYIVATVVGLVALIVLGLGISSRFTEKNEFISELKGQSAQLKATLQSLKAETAESFKQQGIRIEQLTQVNSALVSEKIAKLKAQIDPLSHQVMMKTEQNKGLIIQLQSLKKECTALRTQENIRIQELSKQVEIILRTEIVAQDEKLKWLTGQLQTLKKEILTLAQQQKTKLERLDNEIVAPVEVKQIE